MTLEGLIDEVANVSNLTKKTSREIIEHLARLIAAAAMRGERVHLPGFGVFDRRTRKRRRIRNPGTHALMWLPAMHSIGFRPAKVWKRPVHVASRSQK